MEQRNPSDGIQQSTCASKSTVRKVIDAAGFTATAPRYGQMVRNVNKEKRVRFAEACIANDNFNGVIFTDECYGFLEELF
jgi:hypothetical protein